MNRSTNILIVTSVAWIMSGCSLGSNGPLLNNRDKPQADIQRELLQPCDSLPLLGNGAEADVLAHYRSIVVAYHRCSSEKQKLVDLLCRELFRCQEPSTSK